MEREDEMQILIYPLTKSNTTESEMMKLIEVLKHTQTLQTSVSKNWTRKKKTLIPKNSCLNLVPQASQFSLGFNLVPFFFKWLLATKSLWFSNKKWSNWEKCIFEELKWEIKINPEREMEGRDDEMQILTYPYDKKPPQKIRNDETDSIEAYPDASNLCIREMKEIGTRKNKTFRENWVIVINNINTQKLQTPACIKEMKEIATWKRKTLCEKNCGVGQKY